MTMRTVLTYGTFDLFHVGHLQLLERARALGGRLVVGVSTDEFNASKGKSAVVPFEQRIAILNALRCVDLVFPERAWEQKERDIADHGVGLFVMGDDWTGKFDHFATSTCEVMYIPRTTGVSTTYLRQTISQLAA
jgi:glycerol-3-phosphate cytidylyltransferase